MIASIKHALIILQNFPLQKKTTLQNNIVNIVNIISLFLFFFSFFLKTPQKIQAIVRSTQNYIHLCSVTSSISIYIPKYYACSTKKKSLHQFTWHNSVFFFHVMYYIRNEDALLFLVIVGTWKKHQEFCISLYPVSLPSIFYCSPKTTTVVMVNK